MELVDRLVLLDGAKDAAFESLAQELRQQLEQHEMDVQQWQGEQEDWEQQECQWAESQQPKERLLMVQVQVRQQETRL